MEDLALFNSLTMTIHEHISEEYISSTYISNLYFFSGTISLLPRDSVRLYEFCKHEQYEYIYSSSQFINSGIFLASQSRRSKRHMSDI